MKFLKGMGCGFVLGAAAGLAMPQKKNTGKKLRSVLRTAGDTIVSLSDALGL